MKRFLLLIFLLQIAFTNRLFAKTFNISQIDQVKLITEYSDDTKIEDIDTVTYGSYYQSNGSNKEAIEWIVLDREEDSALLLSKYILDKQKFDADINNYDKSTWEISSIRKWLNSKFLNNAFNDNEKSYIKPTTVINNDTDYVEYNGSEINNIHTDCGNDTIDKLFLLSVDEVKLYFGEKTDFSVLSNGSYYESDRVYKLTTKWTNYAGVAYNSGGSSKSWWLRSMGRSHHHPAKVGGDTFSYAGLNGYYDIAGVRPAMWVTLNNNVSNSELTTNDNTTNNQKDERKILGKSINEIGVIDTDQFKSVDEYDLGRIKVEALDSNNGNSNQNMLGDSVNIEGAKVKNGWETDAYGLTFYYNNGVKARGWTTIKGDWYFFGEPDGHLVINSWIDKDGKTADSKLYYVGEDGKMYKNRQTPDGKWVGDDGLVGDTINNDQTNAESIYSNDNRTDKTTSGNQNILGDNVHIEGADVYQNPDGSIQIGGTPQEGAKVQDGWVNDTYYRNGIKVVNEWIDRINGSFITKNGEMTWFDNGRYYLGSDGLPEKSKWIGDYYVDDTGKLLTKTITPDGKRVDGTGKLIVNNSDAIIDENFTGLKDGWYYVNGVKQIDTWVKIDGYNYRFDKDGHNYILNPKDDSSNVSERIDDNQQETNIEDSINSVGKKIYDKNKVYYYAKQDSKNNKIYKTINKRKTKGGLFGTGFFNPFGEGILKKNNKTYYLIEMTLNDETTERLNRYADFSEQHYTFINAIEWVMLYGNTMNNLNVLMDNYGSISPATKNVSYAAPEIGDRYQNGKIQLSFEIESERDNVYNKIVNANVLLIATNNVIKSHDTVFYEEDELGNISRFEYVEDDGSHVNFVTAYVDCEDRIVEYTSSHVGYQLYVKDGITDYIIHKEYIYEPITKFEKFDIFIMGHDSLSYAIQGNKISHLAEKGVSGMNKFRVYGGRIVEECELNTGKGFEDFEKYYVENKDKW